MAKLGWLVRLTAALVAGAAWRLLRRIARRPPRIWHGHWPVHMTRDMVRADRAAGFPSRSVAVKARLHQYALVSDRDFDVVIAREGVAEETLHWRAMIDLHLHGDIWVAYFDCLFFSPAQPRRNQIALRLVRLAGIRVVVVPHGTEILQLGLPKTRYDWVGRIQRDYPEWNFDDQTMTSRTRIDLFERVASLVIAADPATARLMRRVDLVFKYFPVELPATAAVPGAATAKPRIVHAPNHRHVKGTEFLLHAAEKLGIEVILVEGVPRPEALEIYRSADIVADQFCIGAFGVFALEALALGKPVLTYLDREHLATPALNLPIVNTTPENLVEVLAALIAVPELRTRLGAAGRAAVERYHSASAIGEAWARIYRHVWWGEPLALETTRHFDPRRGTRATTEDPSEEAFWPVPVGDLMERIGEAVRRIRGA